jgi:hypothetical protein
MNGYNFYLALTPVILYIVDAAVHDLCTQKSGSIILLLKLLWQY